MYYRRTIVESLFLNELFFGSHRGLFHGISLINISVVQKLFYVGGLFVDDSSVPHSFLHVVLRICELPFDY